MLRQLLRGAALSLVTTAAMAAAPDATLQASLQKVADQARPGTLGVLVMDPATGQSVSVNASRPYLMMSTFKAPIAAAVLSQVDAGKLTLDHKVHLTPSDIVDGSAVPSVGATLKAGARDFTVDELLHGAVTQSDNTAVDALLRVIGGGSVATRFLEGNGVRGMRIDMGEGELSRLFETKGVDAVLASHVDSTTPEAAAAFLRKLQAGELLSADSTRKLLGLMTAQVIPNRIRAGLPAGYQLADKTGTSGTRDGRMAAFNDIGIITAPDGQQRIVVVLLAEARATPEQATTWFAEIGKLVAASM
ncbi:class A beta-lactamase [Luteibacter aegosomatissinici]|uniref:class A beta-lactamase n=1 Tax=Luteibacter aegosomatissinici TaxID=2911539 RepID=UPI001FF80DEF|nr:class A beta-lactamase [Luteibacter aegosomatissinici]UPG92521.1 class A beta-lactamase [Luteibacter aegosomatissinici]